MNDAGAPRRRSRLSDVARLAGVSTMTVVRVLRDPTKVARKTRTRVEAVIRQTNYTPDLMARALASNRSGIVGVVVPLLTNSLIAEIVQGLTEGLADSGLHLLVGASGFSATQEEALIRTFLSRRVEAVYLSGTSRTTASRALLRTAGIPVVEGGNLPNRPVDMVVGFSNVEAAAAATRHLIARVNGPIGYIGAHRQDNDRARDRRAGFEAAMAAAGIPVELGLCIEETLDIRGGSRAMAVLLEQRSDIRGVFVSADAMAVGALFECQRRGIAVPGKLAMIGFDDLDVAGQVVPALTTIRVPRYAIGREAARMIRDRLAGRVVEPKVVDLGFELIIRASA
jgi:LacI family transcriptional regulator, gluconate utilization system Gnt-I transcriptional repressor